MNFPALPYLVTILALTLAEETSARHPPCCNLPPIIALNSIQKRPSE
jgi:hypothetical protein